MSTWELRTCVCTCMHVCVFIHCLPALPSRLRLLPTLSYFDAHGNYYAKDDPDRIQDSWLQEVDWNRVRNSSSDPRGTVAVAHEEQ